MRKRTILITGAKGQLGQSLFFYENKYPQFTLIGVDRDDCDITNRKAVSKLIKKIKPEYVINAAAYTAVDLAENEESKCFSINAYALQNLTQELENGKLIHISSDYVYHQNPNRPLRETDEHYPQGIYAKSKLLGDRIVINSDIPWIILRASWIYSPYGHNFVKTMLRLLQSKSEISVVDDQIGAPTSALDLAKDILQIICEDTRYQIPKSAWKQVYNYANQGQTSWYQFAKAIKKHINSNAKISPIPSVLYPTPAARPLWSLMDLEKVTKTFSLKIPNWEDSLKKCLKLISN